MLKYVTPHPPAKTTASKIGIRSARSYTNMIVIKHAMHDFVCVQLQETDILQSLVTRFKQAIFGSYIHNYSNKSPPRKAKLIFLLICHLP